MFEEAAEVRASKAALRQRMIAARRAIPEFERAEASRCVAGRVSELLAAAAAPGVVSGYMAIGEEIDPAPALAAARRLGAALCLPVMAGRGEPLLFRAWTPGDRLVERKWGIREPIADAPIVEPDVLLLPLLAFDTQGGRLGYGGGFYDRTLASLRARKRVLAIGLAFDQQKVDAVPRLDYDQPVDGVATPSQFVWCRRNPS